MPTRLPGPALGTISENQNENLMRDALESLKGRVGGDTGTEEGGDGCRVESSGDGDGESSADGGEVCVAALGNRPVLPLALVRADHARVAELLLAFVAVRAVEARSGLRSNTDAGTDLVAGRGASAHDLADDLVAHNGVVRGGRGPAVGKDVQVRAADAAVRDLDSHVEVVEDLACQRCRPSRG